MQGEKTNMRAALEAAAPRKRNLSELGRPYYQGLVSDGEALYLGAHVYTVGSDHRGTLRSVRDDLWLLRSARPGLLRPYYAIVIVRPDRRGRIYRCTRHLHYGDLLGLQESPEHWDDMTTACHLILKRHAAGDPEPMIQKVAAEFTLLLLGATNER